MASRSNLAQIHIAKKELALSEQDYRAMLDDRYGVDSAAKITDTQAHDLLLFFQKLGWAPKLPNDAYLEGPRSEARSSRPKPLPGNERLVAKIAVLLKEAGRLGRGKDRFKYAEGIAHQMLGYPENAQVMAIELLPVSLLRKIVLSLEYDKARRGARQHQMEAVP